MAQFFINRPIFAWVLAIVTMLAGALLLFTLPLEQYPDIAPPRVTIGAQYTGASAETVENSVTQIIEQQLKGIDNVLYMSSGVFLFAALSCARRAGRRHPGHVPPECGSPHSPTDRGQPACNARYKMAGSGFLWSSAPGGGTAGIAN